jgi:hypothetical protein
MQIFIETPVTNIKESHVINIEFRRCGFRLRRELAEKLVVTLKKCFEQSTETEYWFQASDPDIQVVQHPAREEGVITFSTIEILMNERTTYFKVSYDEAKTLLAGLERELVVLT